MDLNDRLSLDDRMRIIQEIVPGKQITLAHIIANPDSSLYKKMGLDFDINCTKSAIGIVTMSPSETTIIAGDIAIKASGVELGFVDRITGTLIITGSVSEVESALGALVDYCKETLEFSVCAITRT
jgi:ethanolamine utilization protein EutS